MLKHAAAPTKNLTADVLTILTFACAVTCIMAFVFAMQPTALLTSGILAVAVGLALQSVLADLLAGLALNIEAPYCVGDQVSVGAERRGRVVQTNWRSVHLQISDQGVLVIPNQVAAKSRLVNHTQSRDPIRVSAVIPVAESEPPHKIAMLLRTAALGTTGVLQSPPPYVLIEGISDGAIRYEVRFWCATYEERKRVRSLVYMQAWEHLMLAGRQLPSIPHRVQVTAPAPEHPELPLSALLGNIDVFFPLERAELEALAAGVVAHRLSAGHTVVEQGSHGDSLFVVREGALAVLVADKARKEREVARLGAGDCFGEIALLTGCARSATVRTVSACVLLELSKSAIAPVLERRPEVADSLGKILLERRGELEQHCVSSEARDGGGLLAQIVAMIHSSFQRDTSRSIDRTTSS